MKRAEIDEQNRNLLRRQHDFRRAADIVTDALAKFDEVEAVAVIGSAAKPLWKEVPRFSEFRRAGIEVWHECKDVDLAVWISSVHRLGALRRARDLALRDAYRSGEGPSTANHEVEIFLIEPETDRYLGRLCNFNACPKGKAECRVPGCGTIPFNRHIEGFVPHSDLLASAAYATLYRQGAGRLLSALDLPVPDDPAVAARGVERRLQRILRRARIWRHRQSRGSVLDAAEIMAKTFKVGDHVSWNSEAGRVSGHIVRVHTSEVNYKGYVHHASEDEPQYEIKSDKTDHIALHKGKALRLLRR